MTDLEPRNKLRRLFCTGNGLEVPPDLRLVTPGPWSPRGWWLYRVLGPRASEPTPWVLTLTDKLLESDTAYGAFETFVEKLNPSDAELLSWLKDRENAYYVTEAGRRAFLVGIKSPTEIARQSWRLGLALNLQALSDLEYFLAHQNL